MLAVGAGQSTAQSPPSHEQAPITQQQILRVPEVLPFLQEASAHSHEIMYNVTASRFANASANAAAYRNTSSEFSAWQKEQAFNYAVVHDVSVVSGLYDQLVIKAERYDTLYKEQLSNRTGDPQSTQSTKNALELKTLASEIAALSSNLNDSNYRISGTAGSLGTDLSDPATEKAFDNYVAALDVRTRNVTDLVFRNTTTSLRAMSPSAGTNVLRYGDSVALSGNVSDRNTGVANASVLLSIGGKPITTLSTGAAGHYNYTYVVADVPAGNSTFGALFQPGDSPYKVSLGDTAPFTVSNISAQNALRLRSGSPLTKLSFEGVVTAGGKPVRNATVELYAGDRLAGRAITDENGAYEVTYGMNRFSVLASLLQPSAVTFQASLIPGTYPLEGIASNSVDVPLLGASVVANPVPIVGGALVAIAIVILLVVRVYQHRRKRTDARAAVEATAPVTDVLRPIAGADAEVSAEDTSRTHVTVMLDNVEELVNNARALCVDGAQNQAVIVLYRGAISLAAELSGLVIEPGMTHRERLALIEQSTPLFGEPLRALTSLFELAHYSGRKLSKTHVGAAIDTLRVLSELGRQMGGE